MPVSTQSNSAQNYVLVDTKHSRYIILVQAKTNTCVMLFQLGESHQQKALTTERQQPHSSTSPHLGPISQPNKNCGSVTHRDDETPNEERTGLSESEQRPECVLSTSSNPTQRQAVDSIGTVVTGTVSGPETPTEERTGSAVNDQYPECTPSTLSHQGLETAVEYKDAPLTNTANENTRGQNDLSGAVPSATPLPEGQEEPIANEGLGGGNTTSETALEAAEAVRGAAVLEGSEFPNPLAQGNTHNAGQESTSQELSERERNASESASRTSIISTEPQQKAPETQDLLGSSSPVKDSKKHAQVSNRAS